MTIADTPFDADGYARYYGFDLPAARAAARRLRIGQVIISSAIVGGAIAQVATTLGTSDANIRLDVMTRYFVLTAVAGFFVTAVSRWGTAIIWLGLIRGKTSPAPWIPIAFALAAGLFAFLFPSAGFGGWGSLAGVAVGMLLFGSGEANALHYFDKPIPDADAYIAELRGEAPGLMVLGGRARWLIVDYGVRLAEILILSVWIGAGEHWAILAFAAAITFGLIRWLALRRRTLGAALVGFGIEGVLVVALVPTYLYGIGLI